MPLNPEQAKTLLESNAINLVNKVKDGKPLTAGECKMLQTIASGNKSAATYVSNQVELAEALGVTRQSIQAWLKIEGNPGKRADGRYHVPSWREWALHNGRKIDDPDKSALQARNILLQNERLQLAIDKQKGLLIPKELAKQIFTRLVIAAKTRCFAGIPRLVTLARVAKDTTEATEEIRKEFNDIWEHMSTGEWAHGNDTAGTAGTDTNVDIPPNAA